MKKQMASIVTALALLLALCPVPAGAAGAAYTVHNQAEFEAAMAGAQSGDIIELSGSVVLVDPASQNNSLIINKNVTIRGGSLCLRYCGILLGADVTFDNVSLEFPDRTRNAIMANGHTLTLNNVTRHSSGQQVHLFCGGLTGYPHNAPEGPHGQIVIRGKTNLGNLYGGSISADGSSNVFSKPATITIDSSVDGKLGAVYAGGALQTPVPDDVLLSPHWTPAPPTPSVSGQRTFVTQGDVTINLYKNAVTSVDGKTGGSRCAQVNFTGDANPTGNVTLADIGGLSVLAGSLTPAAGSSFSGTDAAVSVAAGACLGLNKFGSAPVIGGFTGGGTLLLEPDQTLTITGAASGSTTVGIGYMIGENSSSPVAENYPCIVQAQHGDSSFVLAPYAGTPHMKLVYDDAYGAWVTVNEGGAQNVILDDFTPGYAAAWECTGDAPWVTSIPLNPVFSSNSSYSYVDFIPWEAWTIRINDQDTEEITISPDEGEPYPAYAVDGMAVYVADNELAVENIYDEEDGNFSPVKSGLYKIEITISGDYTASGQPMTRLAVLDVRPKDMVGRPIPILVPEAIEGLKWTGGVQIGVLQGTGYTIEGNTGTNVGSYTATATIEEGYEWIGDSTETEQTISWSIAKADGPAAPRVTGIPASSDGSADGKIIGTTGRMEYSADSDFSGTVTDCGAGETAGLAPGTYYIRVKETNNQEAGKAAEVRILAGAPTVSSIQIDNTGYKKEYTVGEPLDVSGMTLTVNMSDGSARTVAVTDAMVTGFDSSAPAASRTLTVQYGGQSASCTISVNDLPKPDVYTVTVNGAEGTGSYIAGSTVSVSAGTRAGYTFAGWTATGVTLSDAERPDISFTMPENDVTLTAAWRSTDGSGDGSGSGSSSGSGSGSGSGSSSGGSSSGGSASLPVSSGGKETVAAPSATVNGETAVVNITDNIAAEVIKQAADNNSGKVVITPVQKKETSRMEVTVSAAVLKELDSKTDAALLVNTPAAGISISKAGLNQLGQESGPITIAAGQVDGGIEVSITAGSRPVGHIAGGLTVTVPHTGCTPGTVAVAVNPDGTRQIIRKSLAAEDSVAFPLEGPAQVEILDNSKSFDDVPSSSWAADAIAFTSARELFSGVSATSFMPDAPMTRGMLATVLHNLENNPARTSSAAFSDVTSGAWYSGAVDWAAENGIISGYGNGQFGPDDNITREQLAVMLWRYANKPAAADMELRFSDADQASSWALDALRWAVENGILNGYGGGRLDPQGQATRAQVAQMLKNYLERE